MVMVMIQTMMAVTAILVMIACISSSTRVLAFQQQYRSDSVIKSTTITPTTTTTTTTPTTATTTKKAFLSSRIFHHRLDNSCRSVSKEPKHPCFPYSFTVLHGSSNDNDNPSPDISSIGEVTLEKEDNQSDEQDESKVSQQQQQQQGQDQGQEEDSQQRRIFLASIVALTAGILKGKVDGVGYDEASIGINAVPFPSNSADIMTKMNPSIFTTTNTNADSRIDGLPWEVSPVNKRSGVTVFDAEQSGYNVKFVTYLSRLILTLDKDCQAWWIQSLKKISNNNKNNIGNNDERQEQQFAAFSASVEVGLQQYSGPNGPKKLLQALLKRYTTTRTNNNNNNNNNMISKKEVQETRRQIALLFGLLETGQPVQEISNLLAAIENGTVTSVEILDPGSGYAPGYGSPRVTFPQPQAQNIAAMENENEPQRQRTTTTNDPGKGGGDFDNTVTSASSFEQATGRAILRPNGKLLRLDLVTRGFGYSKAPQVEISPPSIMLTLDYNKKHDTADRDDDRNDLREQKEQNQYCGATAKAFIFRSGPNKGRIERIQLVDPGMGYAENEAIKIRISPPEMTPRDGGFQATAVPIFEYEVGGIEIVNGGSGYEVDGVSGLTVRVEPPPISARVNMNDPMNARIISPNEPLPATTIPSDEMKKRMPDPMDPNSVTAKVQQIAVNDGKGGAGGCIGRACYDRSVVAKAYTKSKNGIMSPAMGGNSGSTRVRGTTSGFDSGLASFGNGISSSSSELLSLLPAGIGLRYDEDLKRYKLASGASFPEWTQALASNAPLSPEYGIRGRSPIEREMELGIGTYLRFVASGAICCSVVHLAVTPIDVVKTKVQTDPERYPGVIQSFQTIVNEEGLQSFFTGWLPTFVGFFGWGGVTYAATEFFHRMFGELAPDLNEAVIILLAAAAAAFGGCLIIAPFESVRIRSVAQPDFSDSTIGVANRMIDEEGLESLFKAVPAFWLKEVPFAMAKFPVFYLFTKYLYAQFPQAAENVKMSLLISLAGGLAGGFIAAIVSNPADATISEMKRRKGDMGTMEAMQILLDRDGVPALFRGLLLRVVFYAIVVSLQFLIYDSVRIALGVGSDDLKLYLNVLAGALQQENGGPL